MQGLTGLINPNYCSEARVDEDRSRFRKSCNTCTRAKKKCDGGLPCKYCGKWSISCVYSQRQRPGPTIKNNRELSSGGPYDKTNSNKNQLLMMDIAFIRYYITEMNGSIPLITHDILSVGIRALLMNLNNELVNPDVWACVSLTWTACALGANLCRSDRFQAYVVKSRAAIQRCFDSATPSVARAFIGLEILRQVTDFDHSSSSKSIAISKFIPEIGLHPQKSKKNKSGMYQALGEAVLSQLESWEIDTELLYLANTVRAWNFAFSDTTDDLNSAVSKVALLSEENLASLSAQLKIPSYTLNVFVGWNIYFKNLSYANSLKSPIGLGAKYSMDHNAGFQQDINMIRYIESFPVENQDSQCHFMLLASLGMHSLKLNDYSLAMTTMSSAASVILARPSILSTPMVWRFAFTVASALYYLEKDPVGPNSPQPSTTQFACKELCKLLILTWTSVRRLSRNMGDDRGFHVPDLGPNGELIGSIHSPGSLSRGSSLSKRAAEDTENLFATMDKRSRIQHSMSSIDNNTTRNSSQRSEGIGMSMARVVNDKATSISSIAQILAAMSNIKSVFKPAVNSEKPSTQQSEVVENEKPPISPPDRTKLLLSAQMPSISDVSEISYDEALDDPLEEESLDEMHNDNDQNTSFRSINSAASFDVASVNSIASNSGNGSMSGNILRLSELDLDTLAAILDLHLNGLVDDLKPDASSKLVLVSSAVTIDQSIRQDISKNATGIVFDSDILANVAFQHLKSADATISSDMFSTVENVVNFVFNSRSKSPTALAGYSCQNDSMSVSTSLPDSSFVSNSSISSSTSVFPGLYSLGSMHGSNGRFQTVQQDQGGGPGTMSRSSSNKKLGV